MLRACAFTAVLRRQCVPQLLGMLGVQVDLILRAVQPEADLDGRGVGRRRSEAFTSERGRIVVKHVSSANVRAGPGRRD